MARTITTIKLVTLYCIVLCAICMLIITFNTFDAYLFISFLISDGKNEGTPTKLNVFAFIQTREKKCIQFCLNRQMSVYNVVKTAVSRYECCNFFTTSFCFCCGCIVACCAVAIYGVSSSMYA